MTDVPDDVLAAIERRTSHPAYRQQHRRVIGFELQIIREPEEFTVYAPGSAEPVAVIEVPAVALAACLAEGCGALYVPGDPRMVAHHQAHRKD